jgi:hypothetical protein
MNFLKKHYEKILLGLMLAGLIGVLVFMIFYIAADKNDMESKRDSYINPTVKALPDLDLSAQAGAVARLNSPYVLDFDSTNKLLNPMEWQMALDRTLIPAAKKTGLQVAVVTNITPLYLVISLNSVKTNELGALYVVVVERQAAAIPAKRAPVRRYVSVGDKANDIFALQEVKGPSENPEALVLKLVDSGEVVTLLRDQPYRRPEAYAADLRYDPEKIIKHGLRVGSPPVAIGGTLYTVVEVNPHELILSDQTNQKKTSLPFAP